MDRPNSLALFERISLIAFGIATLRILLGFAGVVSLPNNVLGAICLWLLILILALIVSRKGYPLSRISFVLLISIPTIVWTKDFPDHLAAEPIRALLNGLSLSLFIIATFFLFTKESRDWFSTKRGIWSFLREKIASLPWPERERRSKRTQEGYGWLGTAPWASQVEGFFVDQNNQILFWPKKSENGYRIDEDISLRLMQIKSSSLSAGLTVVACIFVLLIFPIAKILASSSYPFVENYFAPKGLVMGFVLLLILVFIAGAIIWNNFEYAKFKRPKIEEILKDGIPVTTPRPSAKRIKPGNLGGRITIWFAIAILLPASAFGLYYSTEMNAPIGDRVSISILASGFLTLSLVVLWLQIVGVGISDAWFYKPQETQQRSGEVDSAQNTSLRSKIDAAIGWITSSWRFWLIVCPLVFVSTIGFLYFTEDTISPHELPAYYEEAVFGAPNEASSFRRVNKWAGDIAVYIDDRIPKELKKELASKLEYYGLQSGKLFSFSEKMSEEVNLVVKLNPELQTGDNGEHEFWRLSGTQEGGNFKRVEFNVSIKTLQALLGASYFGDSKKMDRVYRRVATDIALKSFGLGGRYRSNNDRPVFVDRSGKRHELYGVLVAMHYDARVNANGNSSTVLPKIEALVQEIEQSSTFGQWVRNRRNIKAR